MEKGCKHDNSLDDQFTVLKKCADCGKVDNLNAIEYFDEVLAPKLEKTFTRIKRLETLLEAVAQETPNRGTQRLILATLGVIADES